MDMEARKKALEQTMQQAQQQINEGTQRLISARAQLELLGELMGEPQEVPRTNGSAEPVRANAY